MRDKLIELIIDAHEKYLYYDQIADYLIANGVTFAKDNNVLTNGDRIRAMTDEEIANFLCNNTECGSCRFGSWIGCEVREWLKQPVEEEKE